MSASEKIFVREGPSVACPFFMPIERLVNGAWPHPRRLPLGCGWSGHCTAPGHDREVPAQEVQQEFCNLGYAGSCHWLPPERAWDAVRFALVAPESGTRSQMVRLHYSCERAHRPIEHGRLSFDAGGAGWMERHPDRRVQKMAECFLESCMARNTIPTVNDIAS